MPKTEHEDGKNVGLRIKEERKRLGLSQYEIESKAGLCRNYLSMIETGKRIPALNTITKLAKVLGVPINFLIERRKAGYCPVADQREGCEFGPGLVKPGTLAYEAARVVNDMPEERQALALTVLRALSIKGDAQGQGPGDKEDELG